MPTRSGYHRNVDVDLTPRQRDVLRLIAQGKSNPEIADALGIGYESVLSYVSDVLSKLGVDRREEAAAWWHEEHSLRRQATRLGAGLLMFSPRTAAAGAAVIALGFLLTAVILMGRRDNDSGPGATSSASPPATAAVSPQATPQGIVGLFTDPRPAPSNDIRSLPSRPPSPFQPWDRESVRVYDTSTNSEHDFGPGLVSRLAFAGDTAMVYTAQGQAWLLDLSTFDQRSLGPARTAFFLDQRLVALILPGSNSRQVIDIASGEQHTIGDIDDPILRAIAEGRSDGSVRRTPDGYMIVRTGPPSYAAGEACKKLDASAQSACYEDARHEPYAVEDASGRTILQFSASRVVPAGTGELVVATAPLCDDGNGGSAWCSEVLGRAGPASPATVRATTNIFVVDIESGRATFVATARIDQSTVVYPTNWPLDASRDWVVWTDNYCGPPDEARGTRIFDRRSGTVSRLDTSAWVQIAGEGLIGVDEFGPDAIFEADTLEWRTVLPSGVVDVAWSASHRFAAVGRVQGHGGMCGG